MFSNKIEVDMGGGHFQPFAPGLLRLTGGGGSFVAEAQGARVTPSTIPLGGFDGVVAQGEDVPGPREGAAIEEAALYPVRALEASPPGA